MIGMDSFLPPRALKAKSRIGLCCLAYGLLPHRSHRINRERWPQTFGNCSLRLFGDRLRRLLHNCSFRFFGDRLRWLVADCLHWSLLYRLRRFFRAYGGPLFRDRCYRLIWDTRCRFLRNHLNHVVRFLLIVTRKIQRRRSQRLRMNRCAGNDKKRCSCECPEGRSFPHEGEVMPGIVPLGKLFFWFF